MGPALLCFDGSDDARAAIRAAGTRLRGAAVVVTVWESMASETTLQPLGKVVGRVSGLFAEVDEIAARRAHDHAGEGAGLATAAGFDASSMVRTGRVWPSIVAAADEVDAGTIVLGARGLGAVGSLLMGSVSIAVLHHARRPVLVVPAVSAG